MNRATLAFVAAVACVATPRTLPVHGSGAPKGLRSEHNLPDRYPYVVKDILKYCQPKKGFWIDLGAGKGQVAIPLIEATGNPVVMLDPDAGAMSKGLDIARKKGLDHRLFAVVGVAEKMPFPDNSADLVVSRGSIFFWDDPVKGLREVYRVLRPGGKAYIGGGAGSGYPKEAAQKLIEGRKQKMQGEEAAKWKRFVGLRRPEQMKKWAKDAGLPTFQVMGKGAISAEDTQVGQGVWLLFEKQPEVVTRKSEDKVAVEVKGDTATYTITSPSGIGGAVITPSKGWPKKVILRLHLRGLEALTISGGSVTFKASVLSHSGHRRLLRVVEGGQEKSVDKGDPYWTDITAFDAKGKPVQGLPGEGGYFGMVLPEALFKTGSKSLTIEWIGFYRN
jgi:SAM-dependent methyltransferase